MRPWYLSKCKPARYWSSDVFFFFIEESCNISFQFINTILFSSFTEFKCRLKTVMPQNLLPLYEYLQFYPAQSTTARTTLLYFFLYQNSVTEDILLKSHTHWMDCLACGDIFFLIRWLTRFSQFVSHTSYLKADITGFALQQQHLGHRGMIVGKFTRILLQKIFWWNHIHWMDCLECGNIFFFIRWLDKHMLR